MARHVSPFLSVRHAKWSVTPVLLVWWWWLVVVVVMVG